MITCIINANAASGYRIYAAPHSAHVAPRAHSDLEDTMCSVATASTQ